MRNPQTIGLAQTARAVAESALRHDRAARRPEVGCKRFEHHVKQDGLTGSPAYPASKAHLREFFTTSVKRSYRPAGTARQLMAIVGDGDRTKILPGIRIPTHVIHGAADVLVPVRAGRDLGGAHPRRHA